MICITSFPFPFLVEDFLTENPPIDLRLLDFEMVGTGVYSISRGGVKRSGGGTYIGIGVTEWRLLLAGDGDEGGM